MIIGHYHYLSNIAAYSTKYPEDVKKYLLDDFEMFEVREPGGTFDRYGDIIETCYNTMLIGKNGICETYEKKPYNWGFCSRSCNFADVKPNQEAGQPLEETTVIIKNRAPRGSRLERGNNK